MTSNEELLFDENGVPILRNVVDPQGGPENDREAEAPLRSVSLDTLARELLGNPTLRNALDEFAAELSLNIYQHIDRSIRPVIEQAITSALDEAGNSAYDEIRQRLESTIPDILVRILEEAESRDR
jgi:hypothetical protein